MAYFLEPLIKLLDQILRPDQHHQRWILDHDKVPQIECLLEKAIFMRNYLENSAASNEDSVNKLENKIRDVVENAEDVIESHIADQVSSSPVGQRLAISPPDVPKIIEEFDSAKEEMVKIMDGVRIPDNTSQRAVSSRSDPNPKKILVGFTDNLNKLRERVFDWSTKLEIIPIVGMGGIGKTTLARKLFDDPSALSYFDVLAWATVSQDYNVLGILVDLLSCVTGSHTYDTLLNEDETLQNKENEVGITLYKNLIGRRYLVVLDDMWHPKAWDAVKMFFPNEQTRSRIILTTREFDVATYVDPESSPHKMHLLNDDDSWELLRKKVYGEEHCPPNLEKLGIEIAKGCRGLPLAVHVIGGLLSHAASWEQVANDVSSTVANEEEHISRMFTLSYNHLPHHLRPCFLYMAAFPENYEIQASKITKLWVAEGFLRPIENTSLEETAEAYLKALVERNLIFIRKQDIRGKVKAYGIHDLLRDLCVRKAQQKGFLYVKNEKTHINPEDTLRVRRVSDHAQYHNEYSFRLMQVMSLARTFLYINPSRMRPSRVFLAFRLLKVLDAFDIKLSQFPKVILQLVNLRYLAFTSHDPFPNHITTLGNLQTLLFRMTSSNKVASEIFHLPQLRHIKVIGGNLSCNEEIWRNLHVQESLQSLSASTLGLLEFQTFLRTFPNLKKLSIHHMGDVSTRFTDLTHFHKLETLKLSGRSDFLMLDNSANLSLPHSLKKLSLTNCKLKQKYMSTIGMLPNLEILKLRNSTFENPKWEPSEGEFRTLQLLQLQNVVNLFHLTADQNNFSALRQVVIRQCATRMEISTELGEIPTLELIDVDKSSPKVADTARKILQEQRDYGNDLLQVRISGGRRWRRQPRRNSGISPDSPTTSTMIGEGLRFSINDELRWQRQ